MVRLALNVTNTYHKKRLNGFLDLPHGEDHNVNNVEEKVDVQYKS